MSYASSLERQMLNLINAERTSRGFNPVQLELRLNESSEDHSRWMLATNTFDHTGVGGSSAGDRMESAGFKFSGSWTWAENIAWQTIQGAPSLSDDVIDLHTSLMNSSGHRANILNPNVTVIGIGIETGNFNGRNAIMVTQNFARTTAPVQVDNGAPGDPPAPPPSAPARQVVSSDTTGTDNADWLVLESGTSGRLEGRAGNDILTGRQFADTLLGGGGDDVLKSNGGNDVIFGESGNDKAYGSIGNDRLHGGSGKDELWGGQGADYLSGDDGADFISGGFGKDVIRGGNGNDRLFGNRGADNLKGQAGDDVLNGGFGNDRLDGGAGNDVMTGSLGADDFVFATGRDRVTDFQDNDQIVLNGSAPIRNYGDLRANHMFQSGQDVLIYDGLGNSLLLEDTLLAQLDQSHFLF